MINLAIVITFLILIIDSSYGQDTIRVDAFLQQVERSHPSLRVASYEPDIAEAEIRNALGRFDPRVALSYEFKDKSGTEKVNLFDAAVELPIDMLFGPKIKAQYSRGLGFQLDPENATALTGEASLGVTLPLFQGIFTDTRRNALRKAMLRPDMAQAQFKMDRNNLLRSAAMKYWDWSEAIATMRVIDTLVLLAERRLSFITRRAQAGESAAIDSIDIAQELLRRRGERLRFQRSAEQAAIEVSVFLWTPDGTPDVLRGLPLALPDDSNAAFDLERLLTVARELRPEVRRAALLQQTSVLDRDLAQELLRPFVEAEAGVITYDVGKGFAPDFKIGVRVDQPLLFRSASAQHEVADITVQRADWQRILVDRSVTADVQQAILAVDRSRERLTLANDEVRLARQMVSVEERRIEAGDADLLSLNLRERFLADALFRLVSARADLAKALVWLSWATGTL